MTSTPIIPVLLSGGTGARLWPLSRSSMPKQFQALAGEKTLLQQAALRACSVGEAGRLIVVANEGHRFLVGEQLREAGFAHACIVLEPVARSTAPAVTVAALLAVRDDPQALILIAAADHVITDETGFRVASEQAAEAARQGWLTLFGMRPSGPATGYGYIRIGEALADAPGAHRVAAFVEKPDIDTARKFVASGDHFWNSGIFLMPARLFLDEVARLEPELLASCRGSLDGAVADLDFLRLDPAPFAACRSLSIDHAVMERTEIGAVVPAQFGWTDVGSWSALWDIGAKDPSGNVTSGDVLLHDSANLYVRTNGPLVATLGVEDLVVIATHDAVLVARKDADQGVKVLVERLREAGHPTATRTRRVDRPWGFSECLGSGEGFEVRRVTVRPGGQLSLQKHLQRAEHWTVLSGTALVTRDGVEFLLRQTEWTDLPVGCLHRLENPGTELLQLIEVRSGADLGDDVVFRPDDG